MNLEKSLLCAFISFLIVVPIKADTDKQVLIERYKETVFDAEKNKECMKIIEYVDLLNDLTQEIPSFFFYLQSNCYFQQKQVHKSKRILEKYLFNSLVSDRYYGEALRLYNQLEQKESETRVTEKKATESNVRIRNIIDRIKTETGIEFVEVKPGCFLMGSPENEVERAEEELQHEVCLKKPFLLGKYEVTQGQWQAFTGMNPAYFKDCGSRCPIENISFNDIQGFIRILRLKTGLPFRLPTEAEWEYSARAGTKTPFAFGNTINTSQVNYDGDHPYNGGAKGVDRKTTIPVGSLAANAWGFHDMHGNVWEFVQDWHQIDYYKNSKKINPKGPKKGSFRVRRGGSWRFGARFCRSAFRGRFRPNGASNLHGFRLALSLDK